MFRETEKTSTDSASNDAITILAGWEASKQYYTIGEVGKLFNMPASAIRFWTKEFGIKVRTTKRGDRLYNNEQIQTLRRIYHLVKENGFTLNGARAKLKIKAMPLHESALHHALKQLKEKLVILRDSIQ